MIEEIRYPKLRWWLLVILLVATIVLIYCFNQAVLAGWQV